MTKLEIAQKDLKMRVLYFLNKDCVSMICDGESVASCAEYLCKRLGICFLTDEEYKMIETFHAYINN